MNSLVRNFVFAFLIVLTVPALADDLITCFERKRDRENVETCSRVLSSGLAVGESIGDVSRIRGRAYLELKEYKNAIVDYTKAIEIGPVQADDYHYRGVARSEVGDIGGAISDHTEALKIRPSLYDFWNRGLLYDEKDQYELAIKDVLAAIEIDGSMSQFHARLGRLYANTRRHREAINSYSRAIELEPFNWTIYANRASSFRVVGDLQSAMQDVSKSISHFRNTRAFAERGDLKRMSGDFAGAIADYRTAYEIQPNSWSLVGIAKANEQLGKFEDAKRDYEYALAHPADATFEQEEGKVTTPGWNLPHQATARAALAALEAGARAPQMNPLPIKATPDALIPTKGIDVTPPPSVPHATKVRRVALVIGNSGYKFTKALPNPKADAETLAATLRSVGFTSVKTVIDGDQESLLAAIKEFSREADQSDWAVVYFAGHGAELSGQNYLLPIDFRMKTDREVPSEAVSLERIMSAISGAKKLKLVVLDACRDNPFPSGAQASASVTTPKEVRSAQASETRSLGRGLSEVTVSGASLVVFAAKHGQLALDGDGKNSPFAIALAQRMTIPNLEINKVFRLVRDDVLDATGGRQEPYTYGSLPGREDFYFVSTR